MNITAHPRERTVDHAILHYITTELRHPVVDALMIALSTAGPGGVLALAAWLAVRPPGSDRRRLGRALLATLGATLLVTLALQGFVARPRPGGVQPLLPMPGVDAFPSGHAALAWCAATMLTLGTRRLVVGLASVAAALLISASRLWLGHHFPTDLLGGAVLGLTLGATGHGLLVARHADRLGRLRWLVWPQVGVMVLMTQLAYQRLLPPLPPLPHADKLLHFVMFGLVAFWLHLWLRGRALRLGPLRLPWALIVPLVLGLGEELAQGLTWRRNLEALDMVCDVTGVLVFLWLAGRVLQRLQRQGAPRPAPRRAGR